MKASSKTIPYGFIHTRHKLYLLVFGSVVWLSSTQVANGQLVPSPTGGSDQSLWLNYFGDQPLTKHYQLHLESTLRTTLAQTSFEQILLRPGLTIEESPKEQALVAYSYFKSHATEDGSFGPAPIADRNVEHRLLEQQQIVQRLAGSEENGTTLTHRFRLEQRWQSTENVQGQTVDWRFSERARYRITLQTPLAVDGNKDTYIRVFNEIYTSFGPHGGPSPFNANVDYAALGLKRGKYWSFELGYEYRRMDQASGIVGKNDNSIQFYVLSTAPLRRKDPSAR